MEVKNMKRIIGLPMLAVLFGLFGCSEGLDTANVAQENGGVSQDGVVAKRSAYPQPPSTNSAEACLWNGSEGMEFVNTGFTGVNAGLWYNYDDMAVGGFSRIIWPIPIASPDDAGFAKVLSDRYGSITGTAELEKYSSDKGFVGVGFIMAEDSVDGQVPRIVDISDWGGLCVTYSAERNMGLLLGKGNDDILRAQLEPSQGLVEKCIAWSEFENVSSNISTSNDELAKEISFVRFLLESDSVISVNFMIAAVGKYSAGACIVNSSINLSSSSDPSGLVTSSSSEEVAKPSFRGVYDLWYGPDGAYRVNTELFDETETGGYWFPIEDTHPDQASRIIWPVPKGDAYDSESLAPIVDYCGGICGTLKFVDKGFAGVGFSIVSRQDDGLMKKGDIRDWDGLCVTYSSDMAIYVVMNSAEYDNPDSLMSMPMVVLPLTRDVTTKCAKWSDFAFGTGSGDLSQVSSLLFVSIGSTERSDFNIVGLGKY